MRIAVANRFWEANSGVVAQTSLERLRAFLGRCAIIESVQHIFVAVNHEEDRSNTIRFLMDENPLRTLAFPVIPWGRAVPALNALLWNAAIRDCSHLLVCSTEVVLTQASVDILVHKGQVLKSATVDNYNVLNNDYYLTTSLIGQ